MRNILLATGLTLLLLFNIHGLFTQTFSWPLIQDFSMYGGSLKNAKQIAIRKLLVKSADGKMLDITTRLNINDEDTLVKVLWSGLRFHFFKSESEYLREVAQAFKNSQEFSEIQREMHSPLTSFIMRTAYFNANDTTFRCVNAVEEKNLIEYCVLFGDYKKC